MRHKRLGVAALSVMFCLVAAPEIRAQCTVTCPANITVSNDPNQCGAVVNYPAPTTSGTCGAIVASPASGSFFPVGTTTVNVTEGGNPACSFTITVFDTQPPTITCPADMTVFGADATGGPVNFPPPVATDNCPGVTSICTPASGSFFPTGSTIVTCTATDASGNTATCSFDITVEDPALIPTFSPLMLLLLGASLAAAGVIAAKWR